MKKVIGLVAGVGSLIAANAYAAIDLPESLPMTDYETFMGIVLASLAVIWVGRKLVKTTNRS
jgi:hypothetical protein